MSTSMRLRLCALMIALSAVFGVIVAKNPGFASDAASGYGAALLTLFIIANLGKKP